LGLTVAVTLWVWSLLFFYAPTYLDIVGRWRTPFTLIGWSLLTFALLGTLVEVSNILKARENKALSYFSGSFFFLVPALIFFVTLRYYQSLYPYQPLSLLRILTLKISVLFLTAIGSAIFFQGVPYLLWKSVTEKPELPKKNSTEQKATKRKEFASIIIFVLALATIILQLVHTLISWKG